MWKKLKSNFNKIRVSITISIAYKEIFKMYLIKTDDIRKVNLK